MVVENKYQEIPVIVGQPFVDHPHVVVIKDTKTLKFINKDSNKAGKLLKYALHAKEDMIIPPNYVGFVKCKTNAQGEFLVEGYLKLKEEENILPNSVKQLTANSPCILPVTNVS